MNPKSFLKLIGRLGLAGLVLMLGHYGYSLLAAAVALALPAFSWYRHGHSRVSALAVAPVALTGLSVVVIIGLNQPPAGRLIFPVMTQVVVALLYGLWLARWPRWQGSDRGQLAISATSQLAAIAAIFLAAAFWHWPDYVVVAAVWGGSFISSYWLLRLRDERAAGILAATWALMLAELSWVQYVWQVNYIIAGGYIIVPQAVLLVLGLGYCLANIYLTHIAKRLSRRRLIEYVTIAGILLAVVVAGTRWNGSS